MFNKPLLAARWRTLLRSGRQPPAPRKGGRYLVWGRDDVPGTADTRGVIRLGPVGRGQCSLGLFQSPPTKLVLWGGERGVGWG